MNNLADELRRAAEAEDGVTVFWRIAWANRDHIIAALATPDQSATIPKALAEQACTISKTGSTVRIDCDGPDEANELFEWISSHPDQSAQIKLLREALEEIATWLDVFSNLDLDESAADGGITSGMVCQQEAKWRATKLRRAALAATKGDVE